LARFLIAGGAVAGDTIYVGYDEDQGLAISKV